MTETIPLRLPIPYKLPVFLVLWKAKPFNQKIQESTLSTCQAKGTCPPTPPNSYTGKKSRKACCTYKLIFVRTIKHACQLTVDDMVYIDSLPAPKCRQGGQLWKRTHQSSYDPRSLSRIRWYEPCRTQWPSTLVGFTKLLPLAV